MPSHNIFAVLNSHFVIPLFIVVYSSSAFARDEGLYVGVKLAQDSSGFIGLGQIDSNSVEIGVVGILGGYRFNRNFSIEADYSSLGRTSSFTSGNTGASAVGTLLKIDAKYSLYGKLGIASTQVTTMPVNTGVKRSAATFGLGVEYIVNKRTDIRIGWDRYSVGVVGQDANVNTYSVFGIYEP